MKRILLFSVAILSLGLVSWGGYTYYAQTIVAQEAGEKARFATVEIGSVESVVSSQGTLEPKNYVDVGAQVSGMIKNLYVDIGDDVKTGQLIAEIDPDTYNTQMRRDEANLKKLEAQKAQQEALIKQAKTKLKRNQRLLKERAVSAEIVEDSQTDLDIAVAQLLSLEAQIEEAQATLEGDKINLNYTKIYATMDGTVVDKSVVEGQTINSSQSAPDIVQIADLDVMTVWAEVAEADITHIKEGMPVYFTTLGSSRKWTATVRQVLPTPEEINDVILYNVLVDVENKDRELMTSMTTQMFFVLSNAENVPVIPKAALVEPLPDQNTKEGAAYKVYVLKPNQTTEERIILVGAMDRTKAAVVSGLDVGEMVSLEVKTIDLSGSKNKQRQQSIKRPGMRGRL